MKLHIQTLVEWDGRGRCSHIRCYHDTWDTYKQEMKTWAARVHWDVSEGGIFIEMKMNNIKYGNSVCINVKVSEHLLIPIEKLQWASQQTTKYIYI